MTILTNPTFESTEDFRHHLATLVGGEWENDYLLSIETRELVLHVHMDAWGGREIGDHLYAYDVAVYIYNRLRFNDEGKPTIKRWHGGMWTREEYASDRESYTPSQHAQVEEWLNAFTTPPVTFQEDENTYLWSWARLPVPERTAKLLRSIGAELLSREQHGWRARSFSSPWQLGDAVYEIFHVAGIPPRLPLQACELGSNEDARAYLARVRRQVDQYELILRTLRR